VRDHPEKHPRHQMPAFSHALRVGVLRLEHGLQIRRDGEDPPLVILRRVGVETDFAVCRCAMYVRTSAVVSVDRRRPPKKGVRWRVNRRCTSSSERLPLTR
jgi:hypothetical protein